MKTLPIVGSLVVLSALCLSSTSSKPSSTKQSSDSFIFPEDVQTDYSMGYQNTHRRRNLSLVNRKNVNDNKPNSKLVNLATESPCPANGEEDDHFCEHPIVYPHHLVSKLLTRIDSRRGGFFGGQPIEEDEVDEVETQRQKQQQLPRLPRPQTENKEVLAIGKSAGRRRPPSQEVGDQLDGGGAMSLEADSDSEDADDMLAVDKDTGEEEEQQGNKVEGAVAADRQKDVLGRTRNVTFSNDSFAHSTLPTPGALDPPQEMVDALFFTEQPQTEKQQQQKAAGGGGGLERHHLETPLCRSVHSYIYPKAAQNRNHKWLYIINSEENNFVQAVRIEKCHSPGGECSLNGDYSFSDFNIRTVCKQKYTYHRLLAVNAEGADEVDLFKFPSCCVCHQVEESPLLGRDLAAPTQPSNLASSSDEHNRSSSPQVAASAAAAAGSSSSLPLPSTSSSSAAAAAASNDDAGFYSSLVEEQDSSRLPRRRDSIRPAATRAVSNDEDDDREQIAMEY